MTERTAAKIIMIPQGSSSIPLLVDEGDESIVAHSLSARQAAREIHFSEHARGTAAGKARSAEMLDLPDMQLRYSPLLGWCENDRLLSQGATAM